MLYYCLNIILNKKLDCIKFNFQMNSLCTEMNSRLIRCNTLDLLHVHVDISNEDFHQGFADVTPYDHGPYDHGTLRS